MQNTAFCKVKDDLSHCERAPFSVPAETERHCAVLPPSAIVFRKMVFQVDGLKQLYRVHILRYALGHLLCVAHGKHYG